MTKMTAQVARKLTSKSTTSKIKTFQDAIHIIATEAKLGKCNCFIDGQYDDLFVVLKELKERGFKVYQERVNNTDYLSVEW